MHTASLKQFSSIAKSSAQKLLPGNAHIHRSYIANPRMARTPSFESSLKPSPIRMHEPRISTYPIQDKSKLPLHNPERVHEAALKKMEATQFAEGHQFVPQMANSNLPQWLHTPQSFVYDLKSGEKVDLIDLDPFYFRVEPRKDVLQRAIVWQLASRRRGTKKTKSRFEVKYSSKKLQRQKGSGKARHGDRGAPIMVGGGRAHPIQPKDWSTKLNKKERYLALRMALTLKFRRNELYVVNDLTVDAQKTNATANLLHNNFGVNHESSALIVDGNLQVDPNFERTSWNLHFVDTLSYKGLNIYDLLHRQKFIITRGALEKMSLERMDGSVRNNGRKVMTRIG